VIVERSVGSTQVGWGAKKGTSRFAHQPFSFCVVRSVHLGSFTLLYSFFSPVKLRSLKKGMASKGGRPTGTHKRSEYVIVVWYGTEQL
jgi:hypothetical protein